MATIASRLTANGILYTDGSFNEVQDFTTLDVSLLVHMDGANGSTSFTDSSLHTHTVTQYGNSSVSTDIVKYGSGSVYIPDQDAGSGLRVDSSIFNLGTTTDFTIEFWLYKDVWHSSYDQFIGQWGDYIDSWQFGILSDYVGIQTYSSGVYYSDVLNSSITTNEWHHYALVRHNGRVVFYLDGIGHEFLDGFGNPFTVGTGPDLSINHLSTPFGICGNVVPQGGYSGTGYYDDFRLTLAAVYTSNFTPPSSELSSILSSTKRISITPNNIFAAEFDEVTINGGSVSQRQLSTGVLQVSGYFDEVTGILSSGSGIITAGLVLYYDISNPSSYTGSNTIIDLSGNMNNGISYNSPTYNSANGGSLIFNGTDQKITSSYNLGENFTVSIVAKLDAGISHYWASLFGNEVYDSQHGYWLFMETYNNLEAGGPLFYDNGQDLYTDLTTSSNDMTNINVYDFVVSGADILLYVNGTLVNSTTTTTGTATSSTSGISFGSRHTNTGTGYTDYAMMNLYSAKIYNRALNSSEILQNYNLSIIPLYIPSPTFKISALDSLSTYTDGTAITSIPNLGTGSYAITSSSNSPTKQTYGGYPVINFNAYDQIYLSIDTVLDMSTDGSVFVVGYMTTMWYALIVLGGSYATGTQSCFFGWTPALSGLILLRDTTDSGLGDGTAPWTPVSGLTVLGIVKSGSTIKVFNNSTSYDTYTGLTGTYQFDKIGEREDYGVQASEGYIGDILFYDTALSDTDAQSVITSLKTKYGIV